MSGIYEGDYARLKAAIATAHAEAAKEHDSERLSKLVDLSLVVKDVEHENDIVLPITVAQYQRCIEDVQNRRPFGIVDHIWTMNFGYFKRASDILVHQHSREPAALPTGWYDVLECALIKDLDKAPLTDIQRLYCYGWFSLLISALRKQIERSGEPNGGRGLPEHAFINLERLTIAVARHAHDFGWSHKHDELEAIKLSLEAVRRGEVDAYLTHKEYALCFIELLRKFCIPRTEQNDLCVCRDDASPLYKFIWARKRLAVPGRCMQSSLQHVPVSRRSAQRLI